MPTAPQIVIPSAPAIGFCGDLQVVYVWGLQVCLKWLLKQGF